MLLNRLEYSTLPLVLAKDFGTAESTVCICALPFGFSKIKFEIALCCMDHFHLLFVSAFFASLILVFVTTLLVGFTYLI